MKIAAMISGLLALLCAWNAVDNIRARYTMRDYPAQVVASKLKVDFGRPDSESSEQPLYTLMVDFAATDGSQRTFHWEGDPGQAVYPEEAFDELARFAPGTAHKLSVLRGNAREIRFDSMETNLEVTKSIGWSFCTIILVIFSIAAYASKQWEKRGPWAVFVAFGMLPLLAAFPVGWFGYERMTTWQLVSGSTYGENKAFDVTQTPPNVELTAKAIEKIPETSYKRFEFVWNGNVLHGGYGGWRGSYDVSFGQEVPRFYINPKDRWETSATLEWGEDFWIPFGILMLFGVVFTGAGLMVRKMKL